MVYWKYMYCVWKCTRYLILTLNVIQKKKEKPSRPLVNVTTSDKQLWKKIMGES